MGRLLRYLRAGFSLIEVNMAIFVLAGGALALLALFPLGLRESSEANSEMRVAAFADRFIGAAKIAAEQAVDEDDFEDLLTEALDTSGSFSLRDGSDEENDGNDYDEDESGVYFRAWRVGVQEDKTDGLIRLELGLSVTAENPKQNPRAMRYADGYGLKVVIDPRGKQ